MYSIKGYKTFKGHEGEPCAQGSLAGPAGKVGDWSDDAWGGPMRIDFTNKTEAAKFLDWAKTIVPTMKDYHGQPYDPATMTGGDIIETVVAQMSYVLAQVKAEEKQAKKGLAYYQTTALAEKGEEIYTWNVAYTAENVAKIRAQYPDAVIINEKLKMPMVDNAAFEKAEENKRFKKLCAKTIVYALRDAVGTVKHMQVKVPYTQRMAEALRVKHGANLVEIINERFI